MGGGIGKVLGYILHCQYEKKKFCKVILLSKCRSDIFADKIVLYICLMNIFIFLLLKKVTFDIERRTELQLEIPLIVL